MSATCSWICRKKKNNSISSFHVDEELTFHVIFGVRLVGFVVVYHLNHLEEIVLLELRECFGELLHVDVAVGLLALLLGLCGCGSVGLACWAGLLQSLKELAFGVAECLGGVSVES